MPTFHRSRLSYKKKVGKMAKKKQTRKQVVPIAPEAVTERPPEPGCVVKDTPQSMANAFSALAKIIERDLNRYVHRQQESEFDGLYRCYRAQAKILWEHAKQVAITLPSIHTLSGDNNYAVLCRILEWCESAAAKMSDKKKKRGAGVRNDHIEEAYKALDMGGDRSTLKAQYLATWINNKYGEQLHEMKPDNVIRSQPWKDCHPKKK